MSLKTIMASDVVTVVLNTDDFATTAEHNPGQGDETSVAGVLDPHADLLPGQIRAADWYTADTVPIADTDRWRIDDKDWRTLHTELSEGGLQRSLLHEALPHRMHVQHRNWNKNRHGAQDDDEQGRWVYENVPAKFFEVDGELSDRETRRAMVRNYDIYLEEPLPLAVNRTVFDDTGIEYQIVGFTQPDGADRMFFLQAQRQ